MRLPNMLDCRSGRKSNKERGGQTGRRVRLAMYKNKSAERGWRMQGQEKAAERQLWAAVLSCPQSDS